MNFRLCRPWRGAARLIGLAILIEATVLAGSLEALAASCAPSDSQAMRPNDVRGVRTMWAFAKQYRNVRFSIQPDLNGLSVGEWMSRLEKVGVNLADINLDPCRRLSSSCNKRHEATPETAGGATDWSRYVADVVAGPGTGNADEQNFLGTMRDRIQHDQYTPAERDQVLLAFLRQLEQSRARGEINGSVKFIVHQRLWFRQGKLRNDAGYKGETEGEFAGDMSNFINAAKAECLDHWLAGIRLGEHSNKNMDQLLPIIVDLATQVNAKTGGWLKNRFMLVNGGGWGANYKGIEQVRFDFFKRISEQTGSFAFGYKWMDASGKPGHRVFISTEINGAVCQLADGAPHPCDPQSDRDWAAYLGDNLGFDELARFINRNAAAYPLHANVLFVGDSSDSVKQMVDIDPSGRLIDRPPLVALRRMFAAQGKDGRWNGRMFTNGYTNRDQLGLAGGDGGGSQTGADVGYALYFFAGSPMQFQSGPVVPMPRTLAEWRSWPAAPSSP